MGREAINEANKPLLKKMRKVLKDRTETVNASRRLVDSPACVVAPEGALDPQVRRMLEATGQPIPPQKPILEINVDHPLVKRLSAETGDERFTEFSHILLDHALLAEGAQLDKPAEYVQRMNRLLLEMSGDVQPGETSG